MTEVELTVNLRPMTAISEGEVGHRPLRPVDFLRPETNDRALYLGDEEDDPLDPTWQPEPKRQKHVLLSYHRDITSRLDRLWETFYQEYLASLRERWQNKELEGPQLKIGQVVIVYDENQPRNL